MSEPNERHYQAVKRILRYVKGTLAYGLRKVSESSLNLYGFFDVDWVGCPLTRRSTTGYCMYLVSNCISWSSKKQTTVVRSSTESEYRALAFAAAELIWIMYILRDIGLYLTKPSILFFYDNLSAFYVTVNPIIHARTKHIEIDYHFMREKVALGDLITKFVTSSAQVANAFTKPLVKIVFHQLRAKLGVIESPPLSLRGSDKEVGSTDSSAKPNQLKKNSAELSSGLHRPCHYMTKSFSS